MSHKCKVCKPDLFSAINAKLHEKYPNVQICKCQVEPALNLGYDVQYSGSGDWYMAIYPHAVHKKLNTIESELIELKALVKYLSKLISDAQHNHAPDDMKGDKVNN